MRTTVTKTRSSADHGLHLALTILTCGLWGFVWIVVAAVGKRTKTTTTVHSPVDLRPSNIRLTVPGWPAPGWYQGTHGYLFWDGQCWTHDSQGRRVF